MRHTMPPSPRDVDLAKLDQQLLDLLEERARALAALRAAGKGRSVQDQRLEQRLWAAWEERAGRSMGDKSLWRRLFTLIQDLPASRPAEPGDDAGFLLYTKSGGGLEVAIDAPASLLETRCWTVLAAATARKEAPEAALPAAIQNAAMTFLVKALQRAGVELDWQGSRLVRKGGRLDMDGKALFVGDDPFTVHLLLFLAVGRHLRLRLTGDTGLKLYDLSSLERFLPVLNARLTPVIPGSHGLPVRLESAGLPPEAVTLPDELDPEILMALAMAAPSYEQGLHIRWKAGQFQPMAARAAALLAKVLPGVLLEEGSLRIPHGAPTLPRDFRLPMDPLLGTMMLAMPLCHARGGEVALQGEFPGHRSPWKEGLDLLKAAGADPHAGAEVARVVVAHRRQGPMDLDTSSHPAYFPLAFALAATRLLLGTTHPVSLTAPPSEQDHQAARELARRLGMVLEVEGPRARLVAGDHAPEHVTVAPWLAPTAAWGMAWVLVALARPGLALANPGGVTEVLPRFWNLFNTLPTPPASVLLAAPAPPRETTDDASPRKRRIKLRAHLPTPAGDPGSGGREGRD